MRHCINRKTLKSVYHGIFKAHICYSSLVLAQNLNLIKRIFVLQKKFWRIIYLRGCIARTSLIFRESNFLKLPDKTALKNCPFINKYFNKFLPTIFKNWFTLSFDFHTYSNLWSNFSCLAVPPHKTKLYGRNSVDISAIYTWNFYKN